MSTGLVTQVRTGTKRGVRQLDGIESDTVTQTAEPGPFALRVAVLRQNRWICALVCCITVLLCATPYNNWEAFVELLYKDRTYSWYCVSDRLEVNVPCEAQRKKLEPLFYFASGAEYTVGVVAGLLFDFWGPRYCGLTGMVILVLGLLSLIISSQSLPLYVLAVMLIGSSTNIVAFPGLIMGSLFPVHKSHALTVLMACQLGSSLVPVIMKFIWISLESSMNLSRIFALYTCCAVLPCAAAYFIFLPRHRTISYSASQMSAVDSRLSKNGSCNSSVEFKNGISDSNVISIEKTDDDVERSLSKPTFSASHDYEKKSFYKLERSLTGDASHSTMLKGSFTQLRKEMCTLDIHLFTVYYIIQVIQFLYFQSRIERIYGREALSLAGYIALLQIVFGIGVAFAVDRAGTLALCALLVVFNIIIYSAILLNVKNPIASIVLNNLGYSFIFTSKITFLSDNYKENNIGQLVGFISFTAGCASILMGLFSSYISYKVWSLIFVITSTFCFGLLGILRHRSLNRKDTQS